MDLINWTIGKTGLLLSKTGGDDDEAPMATPEEVSEMLVRVAAGDREALTDLYAATSRKLFGVVLSILANRAVAENVLQDVYVRIWHSAHAYRPSGRSPMTWLIVVTQNLAIDRLRHRRRTHLGPIDAADDVADTSPSPEDAVVMASFHRKIAWSCGPCHQARPVR